MRKRLLAERETGMTLVEILAALVILGIVFISFMTIFPQMTLFNEKTGAKLESMNLAKRELAIIKQSPNKLSGMSVSESTDNFNRYEYHENNFIYEVDYYKKPELDGQNHEGSMSLHKIHIKIKKNDKIISETFGYIQVE